MKQPTEKQNLARHRNWFKFKLSGMYFPFQKEASADVFVVKLQNIQIQTNIGLIPNGL